MPLILIPLYALYLAALLGVVALVSAYISKSKKVKIAIIAIGLLVPTHDIIITNMLGAYYCSTDPELKTFVKHKVEYPESIYWEDNVYPGFSAKDRELMIMNYLDGVHLKKMALNGDDGKVYVYEANATAWDKFKNLKTLKVKERRHVKKEIVAAIVNTSQKVYTKATMPSMNYTVTFDEVKLHPFSRKFLYSDETKIIDNSANELIAYNRRYMHFFYFLAPDFALGNRYYVQTPVCGDYNVQYFFKDVFQKIYMNSGSIMEDFNSKLYRKYIKGE